MRDLVMGSCCDLGVIGVLVVVQHLMVIIIIGSIAGSGVWTAGRFGEHGLKELGPALA